MKVIRNPEIQAVHSLQRPICETTCGNRLARLLAVFVLGSASCAFGVASAQSGAGSVHDAGPLAGVIEPYLKKHEFAGAVVLVANRNRVLDREAVGYANVATSLPMAPDNLFWIASMSKAMTASATMMLVEEGKIHLDDPVEKYLPEFKGQMVSRVSSAAQLSAPDLKPPSAQEASSQTGLESPKHPITIREILSHTAGLPFRSKREAGALDLLPLKSAVESYAAEPLASQPGEKYSYSNEGINTAGRIVEVVSGMPFEVFLQQRLFSPLGMKDTTFWPTEEQSNRLARSYEAGSLREKHIDQLTYPLSDRTHRFPIPAGGLFSTADDVVRFCQMMLNGGTFHGKQYLTEESVRLITTKETGESVSHRYGFGWEVGDDFFEHSGAYKTDMKVDTKRGLITVLLVQRASDWPPEERLRLMDALEQKIIATQGNKAKAR